MTLTQKIFADQFNSLEGLFWIVLGIFTMVTIAYVPLRYKPLALFSTVTLVAFGTSDFLQVFYGSFFEPGLEWLLVWKISNVMALVTIFVWYIILRQSKS
jgi:hypothetical protein